jgi:aryl-alcohol dehydrogenase-like predicted oxidoreductase
MDPISASNMVAPTSSSAQVQPPTPPDASDLQHFHEIYQDGSVDQHGMSNLEPNQGSWQILNMQMPMEVTQVPDSLFHTAMERLMESQEKGSIVLENLLEHAAGGTTMTPTELINTQFAMSEAHLGISNYQSFDKKCDEGLKTLLTGQ